MVTKTLKFGNNRTDCQAYGGSLISFSCPSLDTRRQVPGMKESYVILYLDLLSYIQPYIAAVSDINLEDTAT